MIDEVLSFWFGELDDQGRADPEKVSRWFKKDPDFDAEIVERFSDLHSRIAAGERESWLDTPRGLLAYVIVLDQFSRNMFRGTPKMYATDEQGLQAALKGIERGDDTSHPFAYRVFLYMPLMHSEELAMQQRCVELFEDFRDASEGAKRESLENNHDYAVQHLRIVERFGRFPHRNEILGRESTPEEVEFLKQPGSSF